MVILKYLKYENNKLEGYQLIDKSGTYAADESVKGSDFYLLYAVNETTGETSTYVYDKLEGTIQRFNTNMMLAYKEKADSYLLYFLLSLVVLATVRLLYFIIVLMRKRSNKLNFA